MAEPGARDEAIAEELLSVLLEQEPEVRSELADDAIRAVRTLVTARDLIDMTTLVFVLRFCAPLLDMVAVVLGREPTSLDDGSNEDD